MALWFSSWSLDLVVKSRAGLDHLVTALCSWSKHFTALCLTSVESLDVQGRSQEKLMTEAMSVEDLCLRRSVHGWVLFLGIKSVYRDKSERNYRGKCLGWPVTSYGGDVLCRFHWIVQFRIRYYRWLKALTTHFHRVSLDLKKIFTSIPAGMCQKFEIREMRVSCSLDFSGPVFFSCAFLSRHARRTKREKNYS